VILLKCPERGFSITEIDKKISVITIFPSPLRERVGVRVLIGKCQVEDIERIEMLKVSIKSLLKSILGSRNSELNSHSKRQELVY